MSDTLKLSAVQNGNTVVVDVTVFGNTNPDTADLALQYDPSSATYNSFAGPSGWPSIPNNTSGVVSVSSFDSGFGANAIAAASNGLVGEFTFTLLPGATNFTASLLNNATYATDLSDSNGNAITVALPAALNLPLACFVAGTLIRTERGDVPVETLRAGEDRVITAKDDVTLIRWIGHRDADPANHHNHPVRIRAHTFGSGRPSRDLLVSPEHAIFVDGLLVPAQHLVNNHTIDRVALDEITYFHVLLERHDIILAESLPVESLLPDNGFDHFENHATAPAPSLVMDRCAPRVTQGPCLETIRERLDGRVFA